MSDKLHNLQKQMDSMYIALTMCAMLVPLLVAYVCVRLTGHNLWEAAPTWGDDRWWNALIEASVKYSAPLGYWGYNGTHALIGTFGPWGVAPLLPYVAFGKLFGWTLYSMPVANIFFLGLANLLFILLTKPEKIQIIYIIMANAILFINICYSIVAMAEGSRYAMAIVLSAMMYRIAFLKTSKIFRYAIVPVTLIFATSMYLILAAFIPLYCVIILTVFIKIKWWIQIPITISVTSVVAIIIRSLNRLFAAPYISAAVGLFDFTDGFLHVIRLLALKTIENFKRIEPIGLFGKTEVANGIFTWFCMTCWILIGYMSYLAIKKKVSGKDRAILCTCIYLTTIFILGYVVLYHTTTWTFIRGTNTALCSVVFLCCLSKETQKVFWLSVASSIVGLGLGIFSLCFATTFSNDVRFCSREEYAEITQNRAIMSELIQLNPESNPWSNTIATNQLSRKSMSSLPIGAGINGMIGIPVNENARYVAIGTENRDLEKTNEIVDRHLKNNHIILFQSEIMILLENLNYVEE